MKDHRENIVSEISIKYKRGQPLVGELSNSTKTADFLRKVFDADLIEYREEFIMIILDRGNEVLGYHKVATGGRASVLVDAKMIFTSTLLAGGHHIIVAHNHPSGRTNPSKEDIAITNKLYEGGKLLDIAVLDHIIITTDSYYSFADEGLLDY